MRACVVVVAALFAACGGSAPVELNADSMICAAQAPAAAQKRVWPPRRDGYVNPIVAENALDGDASWNQPPDAGNKIEGYADHLSAIAGDQVNVMVRSPEARQASFQLYRLGWYGGAGARLYVDGGSFAVGPEADCPADPQTGAIRCRWPVSFSFLVDASWVSGLYVVRLLRDDGVARFVPLIIRDDRPADLYVQPSVTTWQAYNDWGGTSLYTDRTGKLPDGKAVQVSFDRPYALGRGTGALYDADRYFVQFLERWGYDASYTTNFDVAAEGTAGLLRRGAFVDVGHDEYWPRAERDAVEGARNRGMPVLFFGANDAYWQVRPGTTSDGGVRDFFCYKSPSHPDPVQGPDHTGMLRSAPINRPESGLVGEMYENWVYYDFGWMVADESHFLFDGTDLQEGESLPMMVGDEYDTGNPKCMPNERKVAARSPVVDNKGRPRMAETASYRAASGALVFAAGTIDWELGLGAPGRADWRVGRMTANVLHEALGLDVPDGIADDGTLAAPAQVRFGGGARTVSTVARGLGGVVSVAPLADGSMVVVDANAKELFSVDASGYALLSVTAPKTSAGDVPMPTSWNAPNSIVADEKGNLYVSDAGNHVIQQISNGRPRVIRTLAGAAGAAGLVDGAGTAARFSSPEGLALDAPRNRLLVADAGNHRVRAIDLATGKVSTLAGTTAGVSDGPAATAQLYGPVAVAAADDGRVFVVCAGMDGRVAVIGADAQHTVTTLVRGGPGYVDGSGAEAKLGGQGGAVWTGQALLVSDPTNYVIRQIVPGKDAASTTVSTFAGAGVLAPADGDAHLVGLGLPLGLVRSPSGGILVADGVGGAIRLVR